MREHKYRCWVLRDSEDSEEIVPYMGDMKEIESFKNPFEEHRKGNIILMSYTGLKDRTGKEIYEGDIVRFVHSTEPEYNLAATVVQWVEEWCGFYIGGNRTLNSRMNLVVIGNIYQNPELLKEIA